MVRTKSRFTKQSGIGYSDLRGHDPLQVIQREIAYFTAIGHDFEWKTYSHDHPADLVAILESAGFDIGEPEQVLVANADETTATEASSSIRVVRLTDPDSLDDYWVVSSQVWGKRPTSHLADTLRSDPESIGIYVAYLDEIPVGSSRSSFHSQSQFSGLWGGTVLPEYRSKGVYRAMVRQRALDAQHFGARYLRVDALPTSQPILERLGFQSISMTVPCVWSLTKIDGTA